MIQPERGRPYWNPVIAGVALGLAVTAAFVAGRYFGASKVFVIVARFLRGDEVSLNHWMVFEMIGLLAGGALGAAIAGRWRLRVERGPRISNGSRMAMAAVGGVLVMIGSRFALGCTSGLALSGGARLSAGAFVFMGAMFGGGFLAAAVARRLWT